jgi:hypothetical protein
MKSYAARSYLWMLLRCTQEPPDNDFSEGVRFETFWKEFHASQIRRQYSGLDYTIFLPHDFDRIYTPPWASFAKTVINRFSFQLNRLQYLFPRVQRRKNTSGETLSLYNLFTGKEEREVKTVDLEILYGKTGHQVQGSCELRSSWKFSDLKPRYYYCQGGRDYFASRYMKRIAIALMQAIPASEVRMRSNPELHLDLDDILDNHIVYWDFSNFTTSLADLRYFLYYIAEGLRDTPVHHLRLFDYFVGEVVVHPAELIHSYNDIVNIRSPFSLARIADDILGVWDPREAEQQNSGSLGVAGNIGFSTACHAFHVCIVCGRGKCVCVGDDAMGILKEDPHRELIPRMKRLAPIAEEKFGIIPPGGEELFRFLKRAWFIGSDGSLNRDFLLNFPIICFIDGETHKRTVLPDNTGFDFFKKVICAVGNLLWEVHRFGQHITDTDMDIIFLFLKETYRVLGISDLARGALPGTYVSSIGKTLNSLMIPPIRFHDVYDPRTTNWTEFLVNNHQQAVYRIPLTCPKDTRPYWPNKGDVIHAASSMLWRAFEDLELVTIEFLFETTEVLSDHGKRALLDSVMKDSDISRMCRILVVADIPDKFRFAFAIPDYQSSYADLSNII